MYEQQSNPDFINKRNILTLRHDAIVLKFYIPNNTKTGRMYCIGVPWDGMISIGNNCNWLHIRALKITNTSKITSYIHITGTIAQSLTIEMICQIMQLCISLPQDLTMN